MYKIIALDDSEETLELIQDSIENIKNCIVECYSQPNEAFAKMTKEKFDMLIIDYQMEDMNGDEFIKKIREYDNDIYIILLTGFANPPENLLDDNDIQVYWEKRYDTGNNSGSLLLLIKSGLKQLEATRLHNKNMDYQKFIINSTPKIYEQTDINKLLDMSLEKIIALSNSNNCFVFIDKFKDGEIFFQGTENYAFNRKFIENHHEIFDIVNTKLDNNSYNYKDGELVVHMVNDKGKQIGFVYIKFNQEYIRENNESLIYHIEVFTRFIANSFMNFMKNKELVKVNKELEVNYLNTVESLRLAVDARDSYTRGHSDRVAFYALKIGEEYKLNTIELETLKTGAMFHDIGKIGTRDDILLKEDSLEDYEWDEIKKHPVKGCAILGVIQKCKDAIPLVLNHHERINGKGYPNGIKGEDIPFMARIISVVDAFDAMTSDRKYREKMPVEDAINILKKGKGTQFDADIVDTFINLLDKNYNQWVEELRKTFEICITV